jgi:6-pyruvoyltetrahydropterin/6-carboxytetrahydropterin synthase
MVVNIKTVDDFLKTAIVAQFDQKSINDEVTFFRDRSPSLENLVRYIRSHMHGLPSQVKLEGLRLDETPTLYAEWHATYKEQELTITRIYEFAASHRLHAPTLSTEENEALFGKCNNVAGHGHNYVLEVTVAGEPDPQTGMIVGLEKLDQTVHQEVVDRYDHRNLNVDLPEFHGKNPTSEVVAIQIFETLRAAMPELLVRVRLHETARSVFEVNAQAV